MKYKAIALGFNNRKLVPVEEDSWDHVKDNEKDYYESIFRYNEKHYKQFQETHSLAGISDVTTEKLVWDFDAEGQLNQSKADAVVLCQRLIEQGIAQDALQIAFSGKKGFSVELHTDKQFTPTEFKNINLSMAEGLETNDQKIYDAQRIFRITGTRHNSSGLFKYPLTINQLSDLSVDAIKALAEDIETAELPNKISIELPQVIYDMRTREDATLPTSVNVKAPIDLNFTSKPKGFTNCKFALLNGFFDQGDRSNSLMALCATCKGLSFPKEITYGMLKSAARLQAARTDTTEFPKKEIWNTIVEQIYKPTWNGGTYSCSNTPWLKKICDSLGPNKCKSHDVAVGFVDTNDMSQQFENYSVNIEKNTIKTGIVQLDNAVQLTVGMPVALLGAPSSGKTSLSIDILNNTSKLGITSAFFSMDMYGPLVYLKKIQKHFGYNSREVHEIFKNDKKKSAEINALIKEEYKNVKFSLKAGHSVSDMREIVGDYEQKMGDKVKLVVIDYLECISGPFSDATANTSKIAGELRDFATETNTCVITLVQPPKSAGDASSPLTSMRQIKGSSMLEQSFRVILGIYREGFGPNMVEHDRFLTINALKNTMGPLFSIDTSWNGVRGEISELDGEGRAELASLRKNLIDIKNLKNAFSNELGF